MLSLETLTAFFGWCLVINASLLILTTIALFAARTTITRIHAKMFGLEEADLANAYFQYLAQYKIIILAFNLAPYIALKLIV